MKFVIAIEPGDNSQAFGVVVPDLPGCFSAGDTLDEALDNAREAIDVWCETLIEDGGEMPTPSILSEHQSNPEFSNWVWAVVEVPVEQYFHPMEKINITLSQAVVARVDDYVKSHGESRNSFLARAALAALHRPTV